MSIFTLQGIPVKRWQGTRLLHTGQLLLVIVLIASSSLFMHTAVASSTGPLPNYCYDVDNATNGTPGFNGYISDAPGAGCTANDTGLALGTVTEVDGCSHPLDTATFDFGGTVLSTATARYDIGFWFNTVGGDAVEDLGTTGEECSVSYIAPGKSTPEHNLETPAQQDACLDASSNSIIDVDIGFVTFPCAQLADGILTFDFLVTWQNSEGDSTKVCQSTPQYLAGDSIPSIDTSQNAINLGIALKNQTSSKCEHSEASENVNPVPELSIEKTCTEVGNGDGFLVPGEKLECLITVTNASTTNWGRRIYVYDNFPDPISGEVGTDVFDDPTAFVYGVTGGTGTQTDGTVTLNIGYGFDNIVDGIFQDGAFLWDLGGDSSNPFPAPDDVGLIPPNSSRTLTFDMLVKADYVGGAVALTSCNTATLALDNFGPVPDGSGGVTPDGGPDGLINLWEDNPPGTGPGFEPGDNDPNGTGIIGELQNEPGIAEAAECIVTRASISSFSAVSSAGGVLLRWSTDSEESTAGYYIERYDPRDEKYVRITKELLSANIGAPLGSDYEYTDSEATPFGDYKYRVVELESTGRTLNHGPFSVSVGDEPAQITGEADITAAGGNYKAKKHGISERMLKRIQQGKKEKQEKQNQKGKENSKGRNGKGVSAINQPAQDGVAIWFLKGVSVVLDALVPSAHAADAMKINVREDGMVSVTTQEIGAALGMSSRNVKKAIRNSALELSNGGHQVSWQKGAGSNSLLFYGEALSDPAANFALDNVYWLKSGVGNNIIGTQRNNNPASADPTASFTDEINVEQDVWAATTYAPDPRGDFWYWDLLTQGNDYHHTFSVPGAAASGTVVLRLRMQGMVALTDNNVEVSLNGHALGNATWTGNTAFTTEISFDQSWLDATGSDDLLVRLAPGTMPVLLDGFNIEFKRLYASEANSLGFTAESSDVVTVTGFGSEDIEVYDVTDPMDPIRLKRTNIESADGGWQVSFTPSESNSYYAHAGPVSEPHSLAEYNAVDIRSPAESADYIVITSDALLEGAQVLADYRQSTGYNPMVVTYSQIIDDFNNGISDPMAIRDFLAYAHDASGGRMRNVVLAGAGNYDYRGLKLPTAGTNHVPPPLVNTLFGLYAADMLLGDVLDESGSSGTDGLTDLAVGRLPALTDDELMDYVEKIRTTELSDGNWRKNALWIADNAEPGVNFPHDSSYLIGELPRSFANHEAFYGVAPHTAIPEITDFINEKINAGVWIASYIGHGGITSLASNPVIYNIASMTNDNVDVLVNKDKLPIFLGLTCTIARFEIPGGESLGSALVLQKDGGVAAFWGPTALSGNFRARHLGQAFLSAVFDQGKTTFGEAVLQATREVGVDSETLNMHMVYSIIGDPAFVIKKPAPEAPAE